MIKLTFCLQYNFFFYKKIFEIIATSEFQILAKTKLSLVFKHFKKNITKITLTFSLHKCNKVTNAIGALRFVAIEGVILEGSVSYKLVKANLICDDFSGEFY